MQKILFLFFSIIAISTFAQDSFYFWHRGRTPAIKAAIEMEDKNTTIYYFAGEVKNCKATHFPLIDAQTPKKMIATFRIFNNKNLEKELTNGDLAKEIKDLIAKTQKDLQQRKLDFTEIHIDLDCPERLLNQYAIFIQEVKKQNPQIKISITVLICHVLNSNFKKVANACDEFTLQIHGNATPRNIKDNMDLISYKQAQKAIMKANVYKKKFLVALPTYGYNLLFDKETEKFIQTIGETEFSTTQHPKGTEVKCRPNINEILELRKTSRKQKNFVGFIWYRLPARGEYLCWEREFIAALEKDENPQPQFSYKWEQTDNDPTNLILKISNKGMIGHRQIIINFDNNRNNAYGLLSTTIFQENGFPNKIPSTMTIIAPAPGATETILWIKLKQTSVPPEITIKNP